LAAGGAKLFYTLDWKSPEHGVRSFLEEPGRNFGNCSLTIFAGAKNSGAQFTLGFA
jgi:hypothetical protein